MNTSDIRIFRQILIAVLVFAVACMVTQFGNYERAFLRTRGLQFKDYWMLLPMCAPLILALFYLSLRLTSWMEFVMTFFVVGLTGSIFVFIMGLLARPGFRKGDVMAMDNLVPFWAIGTFLVAMILGFLWGARVLLKTLWNLPRVGTEFAKKISRLRRSEKELSEPAVHQ